MCASEKSLISDTELLLPRSFQEDILAVTDQSIESREATVADAGFRKGGWVGGGGGTYGKFSK